VKGISEKIPVVIDSDRACYVLGESWQGNAKGCRDVIFLSVGTGIGAGILADGKILRGSNDIAGAIGWMALSRPFENKYTDCGCFEYYASGRGIAGIAANLITEDKSYNGELKKKAIAAINPNDVFAAYENSDLLALKVVRQCLEFWGMAVANLVSLFNPEKIIFGGGVFGPAVKLIPLIRQEAEKWAQPISIKKVTIESSGLEGDAGVFGAAYLALKNLL
jgi:glucokinase